MLYVDIPTQQEIKAFNKRRADTCVSIYQPTTPLTQDVVGRHTELKNLSKSGRVLAVRSNDIPGGGPVAALLRYGV